MPHPKVSIIIPVYNTEHWISDTINSIKNQTYKNWEAIFVIDGSIDNSEQIVRNESSKDKRILVMNQDNLGLAEARDAGISHASGEYIMFLDSDDIMPHNTLELSIDVATKSGGDIVIGNIVAFEDKTYPPSFPTTNFIKKKSKRFKQILNIQNKLIEGNEINIYFLHLKPCCISASGKIFKKDFLLKNKILPRVNIGEDMIFTTHLILSSKKIFIFNNIMLYYRQNRLGSITSSRSRRSFDMFKVFYELKKSHTNLNTTINQQAMMYSAVLVHFYHAMLFFTPLASWRDFYKKMCNLAGREYSEEEIFRKLKVFAKFHVFFLKKKNIIYLFPLIFIFILHNYSKVGIIKFSFKKCLSCVRQFLSK